MKKHLVLFYYSLLILMLSCQAMYTVYKLGGTIGQGEKLSLLQQKQIGLEKKLQALQESRFASTALTAVAQAAETEYQSIQKPIIIRSGDSVASR